jgi:hypothetical protein
MRVVDKYPRKLLITSLVIVTQMSLHKAIINTLLE